MEQTKHNVLGLENLTDVEFKNISHIFDVPKGFEYMYFNFTKKRFQELLDKEIILKFKTEDGYNHYRGNPKFQDTLKGFKFGKWTLYLDESTN